MSPSIELCEAKYLQKKNKLTVFRFQSRIASWPVKLGSRRCDASFLQISTYQM